MLMIITLSISNCHMIPISLWNLNFGIVISNTSPFTVLWNIFHLMLVTLKHPLFVWPNISGIIKLTQPKLMRLMTWKVLVKPLRNLSLPSTMLDGTHLLQTPIITPLDRRYLSTVHQKLTQSKIASPKIRTITNWLVLRDFSLLYLLKLPKRSMRSSNFSRQKYHLVQMIIRVYHMHKPPR